MGFLKTLGIILVSILLILGVVITGIGITAYQTLLYPETYEKALEKIPFEKILQGYLPGETPQPVREFLEKNFKTTASELITNTLAYLRSDTQELTFKLDINQEDLVKSLEQQAEALPLCSENQLPIENGEYKCRPSGIPTKELVNKIMEDRKSQISQFTSQDVIQVIDSKNNREMVRAKITLLRQSLYALFILILILIFLIYLLKKSSIKKFARTLSINLIIPGLILLTIAIAIPQIPLNFPQEEAKIALPAIEVFIEVIANKLMMLSVGILILGILLLIFSIIKKDKSKELKR
ncbi:MAG TPA: hypothetical protein VJJ21_01930 [Candidatus Nanoarchaeia archaeon]|nr:hypothetical protein [Candidatus Nanoarchaeia archaeon]